MISAGASDRAQIPRAIGRGAVSFFISESASCLLIEICAADLTSSGHIRSFLRGGLFNFATHPVARAHVY